MSTMMNRRARRLAACIGLAAMLAMQFAYAAHGALQAADVTSSFAQQGGDCASMGMMDAQKGDAFGANLCQAHCQASAQIDAAAPFAFATPSDPVALAVPTAVAGMPASAWQEPLAARGAAPPAQLLYARFLI